MPFVITGTDHEGKKFYWKKWSGNFGRTKWVEKFSIKCLFTNEKIAQKTIDGNNSKNFNNNLIYPYVALNNIKIEEIETTIPIKTTTLTTPIDRTRKIITDW